MDDGKFEGLAANNSRWPPWPVCALFAIDLALGLAYLGDRKVGSPWRALRNFIDLGGEGNLPAWYSSMQLAAVALLFGLFAARNFRSSHRGSWALALLPALFLLLSLDEVAQIHEMLGGKSDALFPGGTRKGTAFHRTGIWMFVLGLPFLLVLLLLWPAVSKWLRGAPGVERKLVLGFALLLGGALGVETVSNFMADGIAAILEAFLEETLEMAGATVLFWAGYDLLRASRFSIRVDVVLDPGVFR